MEKWLKTDRKRMRRLVLCVVAPVLATSAICAFAQVSSGTAFSVARGLLVTNQHVVANCSSIEVISADGRRKGSVVAADTDVDLTILRVNGLKGSTARLRKPRVVRLGEPVMVFGYPLAGALSSGGNFTSGLVSALRGLRDTAGEVQITAPVQPGNSGGPLMDASGLVIGVVQAKLDALRTAKATGDIPQNVNFAISLEVLADFLTRNRVVFRDAPASAPLDTAAVAELAQSFTYRIECLSADVVAAGLPYQRPNQPAITRQAPSPNLPTYMAIPDDALFAMRNAYRTSDMRCRMGIENATTQCLQGNDCRAAFLYFILPSCEPEFGETCFETLDGLRAKCPYYCAVIAAGVARDCSK